MRKHLALFKKDFLLQKDTILLTTLLVLGLLFVNKQTTIDGVPINFSFIMSVFVISALIITNSMINDDKQHILMMLRGLPLKREDLVANKYLFTNFVTILSSVWIIILFKGIRAFLGHNSFISPIYLSDVFFSIAMVNFYFLGVFPVFFRHGYAKTQTFNTVIILICMPISLILLRMTPEKQSSTNLTLLDETSLLKMSLMTMFLSFVGSYLSYKISSFLFKKREF
jgi:ABC-2 type transport system permease protein